MLLKWETLINSYMKLRYEQYHNAFWIEFRFHWMEFEFNSIQIQLTTNDMWISGKGIQNLLINMELEKKL
jgi:hypothetical protein